MFASRLNVKLSVKLRHVLYLVILLESLSYLVCATAVRVYSHAHSHGFAAQLKGHSLAHILRTVLMVTLGLYSQYWLLINVSGFTSPYGALLCMLVCRAMFSVPYIHVNIFQVRTRYL